VDFQSISFIILVRHEYDSDEEVDNDGTWEHKQRLKEMEKTKEWATELTSKAKGKHHIGDFLPPEELSKFMDKVLVVIEFRNMMYILHVTCKPY